jgi:hypothetical protein
MLRNVIAACMLTLLAACADRRNLESVATPLPPEAVRCGTFVLSQGDTLPDSGVTCFTDAVARKIAARIAVTFTTVEGAPTPELFTSLSDGFVERIQDTRKDGNGRQGVFKSVCSGLRVEHGFYFVFASCTDPQPI